MLPTLHHSSMHFTAHETWLQGFHCPFNCQCASSGEVLVLKGLRGTNFISGDLL